MSIIWNGNRRGVNSAILWSQYSLLPMVQHLVGNTSVPFAHGIHADDFRHPTKGVENRGGGIGDAGRQKTKLIWNLSKILKTAWQLMSRVLGELLCKRKKFGFLPPRLPKPSPSLPPPSEPKLGWSGSKEEGVEWKKERGVVCVWWYVFGGMCLVVCVWWCVVCYLRWFLKNGSRCGSVSCSPWRSWNFAILTVPSDSLGSICYIKLQSASKKDQSL
jgi:hypothetical protein